LHKKYGVVNSDVNVIHNIQGYRLKDFNSLNRKFCTLEKSGPNLLKFLSPKNFTVNYTVIPYAGVSIIDFRFHLRKPVARDKFIKDLSNSISRGELKNLYGLDEVDIGPEVYNCTTHSTVFIKENIKTVGENVYLHGYFDNENSANRFSDLADYICSRI